MCSLFLYVECIKQSIKYNFLFWFWTCHDFKTPSSALWTPSCLDVAYQPKQQEFWGPGTILWWLKQKTDVLISYINKWTNYIFNLITHGILLESGHGISRIIPNTFLHSMIVMDDVEEKNHLVQRVEWFDKVSCRATHILNYRWLGIRY